MSASLRPLAASALRQCSTTMPPRSLDLQHLPTNVSARVLRCYHHKKVINHNENTQMQMLGSLPKSDVNVGTVPPVSVGGQPRVDETGNVTDCKSKSFGCDSATSYTTELPLGKTTEEALESKNIMISDEQALPPVKNCSGLSLSCIPYNPWMSSRYVCRLVRQFEERWIVTREQVFGITKEEDKRKSDEYVMARWANKVVNAHGDDTPFFFDETKDWSVAVARTSKPKEKSADPNSNHIVFTLRVRPWDETPKPGRRSLRKGVVLDREKDFRIFILNAKSVFKGSYRRFRTRKRVKWLLEKYLPKYGRPGHDYHVIPQRECYYQDIEDVRTQLLDAIKICHQNLDRIPSYRKRKETINASGRVGTRPGSWSRGLRSLEK